MPRRLTGRQFAFVVVLAMAGLGYVLLPFAGIQPLQPLDARARLATVLMVVLLRTFTFMALLLPGIILARQGWGRLSMLPTSLYFFVIVLVPFATGGVPTDLLLPQVPGVILVLFPLLVLTGETKCERPRQFSKADLGPLATSFAIAGIVLWAWGIAMESNASPLSDLSRPLEIFTACFTFGLFAGTSDRRWQLKAFLVPTLLIGRFLGSILLNYRLAGQSPPTISAFVAIPLVPSVVLTFAGSLAEPMRKIFRPRAGRSNLALLAVVNGLNVMDALLTEVALRTGRGVEFNPVASALGSGGKIALVGVASYVLYRIRPSSLLWPTIVLALVIAYHAAGAVFRL